MRALPHSQNRGIMSPRVFDMSSENEINTAFCPQKSLLCCVIVGVYSYIAEGTSCRLVIPLVRLRRMHAPSIQNYIKGRLGSAWSLQTQIRVFARLVTLKTFCCSKNNSLTGQMKIFDLFLQARWQSWYHTAYHFCIILHTYLLEECAVNVERKCQLTLLMVLLSLTIQCCPETLPADGIT